MPFAALPPHAAWRHCDSRSGFEVVFLGPGRADGCTTAVEGGRPWAVEYVIELAAGWITRRARVTGRSERGRREVGLETDGQGRWRVAGQPAPHLDGCLDVDLESSCLTNAFPVHRLGLEVGEVAEAPAAYVRAADLSVERLEQRYRRLDDRDGAQRYRYGAPAFDFQCELAYDEAGLVLAYPGIGRRVA